MRQKPDKMLLQELQAVGASDTEAKELRGLAMQLEQLKPQPDEVHSRVRKMAIPLSLAGAAVVVLIVFVLARGAMPGSPLYPVQQASDSVAIAMHPSYRAAVMMRQAEQVRVLVAARAPSSRVMTALNNYQHQAKVYRAHYADYEVFEHCKDSLRQAAKQATGQDRQAIDRTLAGLRDV